MDSKQQERYGSPGLTPDEINRLGSARLTEREVVSGGIVLTPLSLAEFVVKKCREYRRPSADAVAGDLCSGAGVFIHALNRYFPNARTLSFEEDRTLFQLSCQYYLSAQNHIQCLDTLFDTEKYAGHFDLLVGNPPYVRVQNIPDGLKERLESDGFYSRFLKGAYDLSVAFIAQAIRLLKDGGIGGLILPRKVLFSAYGKNICEYIARSVRLLEVIDFGDNQLFEDKTTYICVLIFEKTAPTEGYSFRYGHAPLFKNAGIGEILASLKARQRTYDSGQLLSFPWGLRSQEENAFLRKIRKNGLPLTSLFSISQGFRTGNNKAFIVPGGFPQEPCVRDYVDGTNIKRGYISSTQRIIWPYESRPDGVGLIPEDRFSQEDPVACERLRQRLGTARDGGSWYGYSRPQNLHMMDRPKIFVKEMMPRAEFAADTEGTICFGTGYALLPLAGMERREMLAWAFILSTEVMEYQYRCIGTNLHSGWFRMYKNHAQNIIVPRIDVLGDRELMSVTAQLSRQPDNEALWRRLDGITAGHFGLSQGETDRISSALDGCHALSMPRRRHAETILKRPSAEMKETADIIADTAYPELTPEEREKYLPVELTCYNRLHEDRPDYRTLVTYQNDKKMPVQRWYKYTQGYSTALVQRLLTEFHASSQDVVFDPFCGGGTTLLVCRNDLIRSVGCDISPLSCWITRVKTHGWTPENGRHISDAIRTLEQGFVYDFTDLQFKSFFAKAFYPEILAQTVYIQRWILAGGLEQIEKDLLLLALISIQEEISVMRKHGSHYRFLNDESHVGVQKLNIKLIDEKANVAQIFKAKVRDMLDDISAPAHTAGTAAPQVHCADIRSFNAPVPKASIVITSPPYLNRNNYFSQQKTELSLLHLIKDSKEYTDLVKRSFCSHVEAALPESPVCTVPEVAPIIRAVEKKKSNNAKIPHMIAGYFNDLDTFFRRLPGFLQDRARIAFVVANCRWNGVVIPLDHLTCRIAERYGFSAKKIIVARMKGNSPQQMREYGRISVRESIVILEYTAKTPPRP